MCPNCRRYDVSMADIQTLIFPSGGGKPRHRSWWRQHLAGCHSWRGCVAAAPAKSPAPALYEARDTVQVCV